MFRSFPLISVTRIGDDLSFRRMVTRGSVGHPAVEGIDYWDAAAESPYQLEICFAIFANVVELDDQGGPVQREARRAPCRHVALQVLYRGTTVEGSGP